MKRYPFLFLIEHPLLKHFAYQILPWDNRDYDMDMKLVEIDTMLPYHSNVDTDTVIAPLNYMLDETSEGNVVFYDIYSEEEKQNDLTKKTQDYSSFVEKKMLPLQ